MIQIRLSQARLSSTVRPEREKFMSSKATEAVTMAAIVEMARIWVYTSCMISLALAKLRAHFYTGNYICLYRATCGAIPDFEEFQSGNIAKS